MCLAALTRFLTKTRMMVPTSRGGGGGREPTATGTTGTEDESDVKREMYFLIANFLSSSPCVGAAATLMAEMVGELQERGERCRVGRIRERGLGVLHWQ